MNRTCLAVILIAASSGVASAGGYIGLGIGTAPAVGSDVMSIDQLPNDGRSGKLLAGARFGQFSVEGAIHGYDLVGYRAYQASASGKLSLPLGSGFEVFGRLGLQHTWFDHANPVYDVDGNGYLLGAGFEYRLNLGVASGSFWVDYQYNKASLDGDRDRFDVASRMWMLGLSIGI
ncbi:MAG: outer membrane beta-barrel protein [Kofleriaceae bacterium]